MTRSRTALRPVLALALFAALAPAQGKTDDAAKKGADLPSRIKAFQEAIFDKKLAKDEDAIQMIDAFVKDATAESPAMAAKEKDAVAAAIGDVFFKAKQREKERSGIYTAAAAGLGQLGPSGAKVLVRAFEDPKFRKKEWVDLRASLLREVGKTKDDAQVRFLVERATRDKDDEVLKAAGEALGNYAGAKLPVRREIAKELINKYNEIHNGANANVDPNDPMVKARRDSLAAITDPWNTTLAKLTGQNDLRQAPEWLRWWNKNKDENWDRKDKS